MSEQSVTQSPAGLQQSARRVPFSVDSKLLVELGRNLVGRPEIALAELIKNAYDADAEHCEIVVRPNYVEVADSGNGMSRSDFESFWMRVGTTHKLRREESERYRRHLTGQKGLGRLSAQFLGSDICIHSRPRGVQDAGISALINWDKAVESGDLVKASAYVKPCRSGIRFAKGSLHGTRIRIRRLRQEWQEPTALKRLAERIWTINSPFGLQIVPREDACDDPGFKVSFDAGDPKKEAEFRRQLEAFRSLWTAKITGEVQRGRTRPECRVKIEIKRESVVPGKDPLYRKEQVFALEQLDRRNGEPGEKCTSHIDQLAFEILVYDVKHRQRDGIAVEDLRTYIADHGGVHVLDGGFRLPYYGEFTTDWLGIESDHARRINVSALLPSGLHEGSERAMLNLPRVRQLLGQVNINTAKEKRSAPHDGVHLLISPGRDRLVDNSAYEQLKKYVRAAVDLYAVEKTRLKERDAARVAREKGAVRDHADNLIDYLEAVPENSIAQHVRAEIRHRATIAKESADATDEYLRQVKAMLGALATAGMAALAIDHELRRELGRLQHLLDRAAESNLGSPGTQIIEDLRQWAKDTDEAWRVFSPLMNEEDREEKRPYRVQAVINAVTKATRRFLEGIPVHRHEIPRDLYFPRATMATWQAILQNLFINAVNAQIDVEGGQIHCSIRRQGNRTSLVIQDKGVGLGIPLEQSEVLFEPFERRLNLSADRRGLGLGGAGLGLTIVRMMAETAGVSVQFIEPDAQFSTAVALQWKSN